MTAGTSTLRTTSLRLRTVIAIVALLAVLLAGLAVAVEVILGARLRAEVDERLHDRASAAAALVGTVDATDLADRLSAQGLSVRIVQPDGAAVVAGPTPAELKAGPGGGRATLPAPPSRGSGATEPSTGATRDSSSGTATRSTSTDGATITASSTEEDDGVLTLVSRLDDGTRITLTASTRDVDDTLVQLGWVMGGASAAFLGVAVLGVVLVVRRSLRPLDAMTDTARSIARGDRGRRLRPSRRDTEIGRVAVAWDEMLDAVEGAERDAVAAEARVRSFLSDAAHELRTPVAGMRAAADTLVRGVDDPATREALAVHVVRQSDRAARLVDDMLTMARLDRGIDLDRRVVDLGALLVTEGDRLRLRLPSVDLDVVVPEHPVPATVDADRLAQVVGNLVDNAARATGGSGRIVVTLDDHDTEDVVRVEDDGPGIPEGERERVFDRLVRLEASRDARSGGAGLGLPIARGIAEAHGGRLRYGSAGSLGGAVFELRLPVGADRARVSC